MRSRIVARHPNRLRLKGIAHRPYRFDGGPGHGRQGRHRHSGDGAVARRWPTRSPRRCRGGISAQGAHHLDVPKADARSTVSSSTTPVSFVVAQAVSRCGRSRAADQCPSAGGRLAQPAVRTAVHRLAEGQPRCAGRLPRGQARRAGRDRTMPRQRSRGSSTPIAARGSGRTPRAGGPSAGQAGAGRCRSAQSAAGRALPSGGAAGSAGIGFAAPLTGASHISVP